MKTTYMAFLSNLSRVFCLESINHNLCINTIQTKTIILYVIIIPGHIPVLLTFLFPNISNVSNASREQTDHITIIIRFIKTKSNFCKKNYFLKSVQQQLFSVDANARQIPLKSSQFENQCCLQNKNSFAHCLQTYRDKQSLTTFHFFEMYILHSTKIFFIF